MNISAGNIFQVYAIDACRHVKIPLHPRRRDDILDFLSCNFFDSLHFLFDFKQPGAARDAIGFHGGGDSQADGAIGAGFVRHDKVGGEWVEAAVYTFGGSIKRF